MEPVIRVLVADNHEVVRRAICQLLLSHPEIEVVCEASDGADAVQKVREHLPDFVLLDVSMPEMNGLVAARIIKEIALGSNCDVKSTRFCGTDRIVDCRWRKRICGEE